MAHKFKNFLSFCQERTTQEIFFVYSDKVKLNRLMNRNEYRNHVFFSKYESTSDAHVNIKMLADKPDNLEYNVLVYEKAGIKAPYFIQMTEKTYALKKEPKPMYTTFLTFSSAQAILSGRYYNSMKEHYEFFIETIIKHRHEIERKLVSLRYHFMNVSRVSFEKK